MVGRGFRNTYPTFRQKSTENNFRVVDNPEVYEPEVRLISGGRIQKVYCWLWLA
jgi:hypothetical protein